MNIETLFHNIGIDLSTFNSNLEKDRDINELMALLKAKLGNGKLGDIELIQKLNKINENTDTVEFEGIIRKDGEEYTLNVTQINNASKIHLLITLTPNNPKNGYSCQILVEDHMAYNYSNAYKDMFFDGEDFSSAVTCQEEIEMNGSKFVRDTQLILGDSCQQQQKHLICNLYLYPNGTKLEEPISRIVINQLGRLSNMEKLYNCHIFPLEDDNFNKDGLYSIDTYSVDKRNSSDTLPLISSLYSYEKELEYDKMIYQYFITSYSKK